ncbi:hypothetical protein BC833DRAFT_596819 [Globomyces pollinis-pini]|nr:hypothetical protein BC833DRAFT_596819 [Globomyces pollinis-pini]
MVVSACATNVASILVLQGVFRFQQQDFMGITSWFPSILYSASVCIGSIGRQLNKAFD